jgi:hypothetical protein
MKVICIENSIWKDGSEYDGTIATYKGAIYHVTGSGDASVLHAQGFPAAPGIWYEFLEVMGVHHGIRFLEIPDDDFEEGIQEEQIAIEEELAKLN